MRASRDSIIIRPVSREEMTKGGIVVPKAAKKREDEALSLGQIVDFGPLAFEDEMYHHKEFGKAVPMPKRGEYVLTAKYAGRPIKFENETLSLCLPGDILAILTEDEVEDLKTWRPD